MRNQRMIHLPAILLALTLLAVTAGTGFAAVFNLKAAETTLTMPDGVKVPMWGFGLNDSPQDQVSVPGPVLVVPPGDTKLVIRLTNNLKTPISLVIPGQIAKMTPVWDNGATGFRPDNNYKTRVMSFTHETPPGQTRAYRWNNVQPGTYLYQSGTNPAVQVQMGLYGAATINVKKKNVYGVKSSYYRTEAVLLFSEVDPAFHQAVADGKYGPNKEVTSAVDFDPKYFLINGKAYPDLPAIDAGVANRRVLLRFLNAGLNTYVPVLYGTHMKVLAEDGKQYSYVKSQYSVELAAGKTFDAIIRPKNKGNIPLFDRRLNLTNAGTDKPGGMLTFLQIQ